MTDYKRYNIHIFKTFVNTILDKKHKGKFHYSELKEEIESVLETEPLKLSGKSFHKVVLILKEDIDEVCKQFFKGYPAVKLASLKGHSNKMQSLFGPIINSKSQLGSAARIKDFRLTEIFNNGSEAMYAYEVYGLAIAAGLKPSQLFHYFYGDGERPVVGV